MSNSNCLRFANPAEAVTNLDKFRKGFAVSGAEEEASKQKAAAKSKKEAGAGEDLQSPAALA